MVGVCFVCLGNICRSPTAEAVMRHLAVQAGLEDKLEIDSAGTCAYHAGEAADHRAIASARTRGIRIRGHARQFQEADWERFDHILALDAANYDDLRRMAPSASVLQKLRLLRSFDPSAPAGASVPDPYYGGSEGFETVLDQCEAACRGLLDYLRKEHGW